MSDGSFFIVLVAILGFCLWTWAAMQAGRNEVHTKWLNRMLVHRLGHWHPTKEGVFLLKLPDGTEEELESYG